MSIINSSNIDKGFKGPTSSSGLSTSTVIAAGAV